jgi:hypothetical protein
MAFFRNEVSQALVQIHGARFSGEPSSLLSLLSHGSVLRSHCSGWTQGSHSESSLSLDRTFKQWLCHSMRHERRNATNSLTNNHRNLLMLWMLRQNRNSLETHFATRNYGDSSDAFEFLTMLSRCNFYKIADLDSSFSRERARCQTIDYLIHLLRTISG